MPRLGRNFKSARIVSSAEERGHVRRSTCGRRVRRSSKRTLRRRQLGTRKKGTLKGQLFPSYFGGRKEESTLTRKRGKKERKIAASRAERICPIPHGGKPKHRLAKVDKIERPILSPVFSTGKKGGSRVDRCVKIVSQKERIPIRYRRSKRESRGLCYVPLEEGTRLRTYRASC